MIKSYILYRFFCYVYTCTYIHVTVVCYVSCQISRISAQKRQKGLWCNGSASDSRSEGWELETLWPYCLCKTNAATIAR